MSHNSLDYVVKTIIIGNTSVGKSTLLRKLTENIFSRDETPTVGVDFYTLNINIKKSYVKVHMWDTAGHERYKNLVKTYFKNNAICYVVYDVCNQASFKSVQMWINTFKNNTSNTNAIIVVLANKIDNKSKRIITFGEGKSLADGNNALYFEVSAKTSINLNKIIVEPVTILLNSYEKNVFPALDVNGLKDMKIEHKKYCNVNKEKTCCIIQ
jgi:Ras-related protein Rab-18